MKSDRAIHEHPAQVDEVLIRREVIVHNLACC